jgi:hypothetical protein
MTHKVLLTSEDVKKKHGGTQNHKWNVELKHVVQNYDSNAYYKMVMDRVFLLSVKQLKEWIYDRRAVLGKDYERAKPTPEAVRQSNNKNEMLHPNLYWEYWLNTPSAGGSDLIRHLHSNGKIHDGIANDDSTGVRPALFLDAKKVKFNTEGDGTFKMPYALSERL